MSEYQVVIPYRDSQGIRKRKKTGWWATYTVYKDGKDPRTEFVYLGTDVKTRDQAKVARNVLYTKLLLEGATRFEPKRAPVRPRKRPRDLLPDFEDMLKKREAITFRWEAWVKGKKVLTRKTKEAALVALKKYLRESELKPCELCGKKPRKVLPKGKRSYFIVHDNPDCENNVVIKSLTMKMQGRIDAWNDYVYKGIGKTGTITMHDIQRLRKQ